MLLCNSLVFWPAIRKPKNLLCSDHNRKSKIPSLVTNKHVSYKASASFNVTTKSTSYDLQGKGGVGIINFFQGKNIFITGGTGLLGKALVEKLLRLTPVGKIYILVKADDHETAIDRITKELINSELFKCLQEKHGKYYQEFMAKNLVPVIGNITEPNLGMDPDSAHAIMKDVNVIIESAANTNINERYDVSLKTNVNGPQRIMSFAKACKSLELLVYISTGT
ncbi:PREDICTED: fatty acyl-CoA reductase 2-like [Erythranthe guttata]|uniref:fatty acyl-CoA reductase 2-like n=1 Tax=Erythranthe guttata TaxID=4155 RepID=UPI00064DF30F|nr:PREDICTED: fatty acyl-CoA reductase 2-like [Erythranthe guttata]|eukprot:XP_012856887.1 PREDICTED: fatty acyl-CoA reductase 2-like [Erythranthe guttata]